MRHKNDCFELEVKTAGWSWWTPHASELAGKEGSHDVDWGD